LQEIEASAEANMDTRILTRPHRLHGRSDDGDAFVPDVGRTHEKLADDDAEAAGEEMIAAATSGDYVAADAEDEVTIEELGGPFLEYIVALAEEDEDAAAE
jgi:hypothetical protein